MKILRRRSKSFRKIAILNELPISWKKWDIIIKSLIGILAIVITFFVQYRQEQIQRALLIMEDPVRSTLVEKIISGNEQERELALKVMETHAKDMFPRFLEALAIKGPDETVRKQAIQSLGEKGDSESAEVLKEISMSKVPKAEQEAALTSKNQIKFRILKNARAFYETGLYPGAADEFKKLESLLTDSEVDQGELELAKVAYDLRDYKSAAEHYIKATEKIH